LILSIGLTISDSAEPSNWPINKDKPAERIGRLVEKHTGGTDQQAQPFDPAGTRAKTATSLFAEERFCSKQCRRWKSGFVVVGGAASGARP